MWPYWILFLVPALAASTERSQVSNPSKGAWRWTPGWIAATLLVAVMVGYRFEVGGDWFNYFDYLDAVSGSSVMELLSGPEPSYRLLNWISLQMGWDIIGVNAMSGFLFALGLAAFCQDLKRPWLALTVAVPYLTVVVAMGYTRQGLALAFAMLGLKALQRRSVWKFVFWVVIGATFHRTAVLLLPIAAFVQSKRRLIQIAWVGVATVAAYFLILADSTENLYTNYVETEYQSEGAFIRLFMNAVPAVLLLVKWKKFKLLPGVDLWRIFALLSLLLLAVLFLTPASTAVDRIALYMLPLQLVVFSALPDAVSGREAGRRQIALGIVVYYALVLFVWLMFGTHAVYWLPYRFYPTEVFW